MKPNHSFSCGVDKQNVKNEEKGTHCDYYNALIYVKERLLTENRIQKAHDKSCITDENLVIKVSVGILLSIIFMIKK